MMFVQKLLLAIGRLWPPRMTIRIKMMIWLSVIFIGMMVTAGTFIARDIRAGNEDYINDDLVAMKKNGLIYAKQILVLNQQDNNEQGFSTIANELCRELHAATGNPTAAYTVSGQFISAIEEMPFVEREYEDINLARGGFSAFTLNTESDVTQAYFSYPVQVEGKNIGLIRTIADYSLLYRQGGKTMRAVSVITWVVFGIALVFALVFSASITNPLVRLADISAALEREVDSGKIDASKVARLSRSRRRDEIGTLSRSFAEMIFRVDAQMKTIGADKEELERLADYRKEFYDSVTHELKTPLTSIRGYAEVLEENGFTDKAFFDKGIAYIREESDRMYTMVVTLLEMSKLSGEVNFPKERVILNDLVREVCEGMQFKATKYGDLIELSMRQRAAVMGSTMQLKEVVINIIDNAIKYGYPNSTIQVLVTANRENCKIQVVNVGEGIAEKEIPKLFIPFYRRKDGVPRETGSSGLGLGIAKRIIEQHGGRIEITSRPKELTCVTLTFPALHARG